MTADDKFARVAQQYGCDAGLVKLLYACEESSLPRNAAIAEHARAMGRERGSYLPLQRVTWTPPG